MEKIELSVPEVAFILESLVQKAAIRRHKVKDGPNFYKINKEIC